MLTALSETLPQTSAPQPRDAPWGLYIHIPFCRRICPYCDFNVYARQEPLIPAYLAALTRELELIAARWGRGPLQTIYLGGALLPCWNPGRSPPCSRRSPGRSTSSPERKSLWKPTRKRWTGTSWLVTAQPESTG